MGLSIKIIRLKHLQTRPTQKLVRFEDGIPHKIPQGLNIFKRALQFTPLPLTRFLISCFLPAAPGSLLPAPRL